VSLAVRVEFALLLLAAAGGCTTLLGIDGDYAEQGARDAIAPNDGSIDGASPGDAPAADAPRAPDSAIDARGADSGPVPSDACPAVCDGACVASCGSCANARRTCSGYCVTACAGDCKADPNPCWTCAPGQPPVAFCGDFDGSGLSSCTGPRCPCLVADDCPGNTQVCSAMGTCLTCGMTGTDGGPCNGVDAGRCNEPQHKCL
jgi:hypothetical protein